MRQLSVITIHPRIVEAYRAFGVLRAAQEAGQAEIVAFDLRDFAVDRHGSVDAPPYGGGDGMVLRPEPLRAALAAATRPTASRPWVILTSPQGRPFDQKVAARLAASAADLVFICGRFAGVDQRFIDRHVDEELSVGDVVLAGGELPALLMIEATLRLLPGVLGHPDSAAQDSFAAGLDGGLEYPLYTRPAVFDGLAVPDVLRSGDHQAIAAWRRDMAKERTARLRPDLIVPHQRP